MDKQELVESTCCQKQIPIEEAILNHGMCDKCMDDGLLIYNLRDALRECLSLLHEAGQYKGSNIVAMDEYYRLLNE